MADKSLLDLSAAAGGDLISGLFVWAHRTAQADAVKLTVGQIGTILGFDGAGGSLALDGADAVVLTTTGATNVTLPTSGTLMSASSADTLTNKGMDLASNTLTGTLAQFNTALTDADFATLAGTETLSNKTLALGGSEATPGIPLSGNLDTGFYNIVDLAAAFSFNGTGTFAFGQNLTLSSASGIDFSMGSLVAATDFSLVRASTGVLSLTETSVNAPITFAINTGAGLLRTLQFRTSGVGRWNLLTGTGAESGSNAGSAFAIEALSDAGASIDFPLTIVRAAGGTMTLARKCLFSGEIEIDGALNHDGTTLGLYGAAPTTQAAVISAFTDNTGGTATSTLANLPTLADAPITADNLREDLMDNWHPVIENWIASISAKVNQLSAVDRNTGLCAAA